MPLGERIRQLRKEAGWSQAELAEKIGADAGRVNKYEAGRMAPAAETLVRLAEVLNVSIDYLLIDGVPRRPLHSAEDALGDRLAAVAELGDQDLALGGQLHRRAGGQDPHEGPRRRHRLTIRTPS